jgi:hypothetical protein
LTGSPLSPHSIVQLDRVRPDEDTEGRQLYAPGNHPGDKDVERLGLPPGHQGGSIGDRIYEQIRLLRSTPEEWGLSHELGPAAKHRIPQIHRPAAVADYALNRPPGTHFTGDMATCILFAGSVEWSANREAFIMPPLEMLFRLEIEYHRRMRSAAAGGHADIDAGSIHTSYALQSGYEQLIPAVGTVTARQIEQLRERFTLAGDSRDLLAARDSLKRLLGVQLLKD